MPQLRPQPPPPPWNGIGAERLAWKLPSESFEAGLQDVGQQKLLRKGRGRRNRVCTLPPSQHRAHARIVTGLGLNGRGSDRCVIRGHLGFGPGIEPNFDYDCKLRKGREAGPAGPRAMRNETLKLRAGSRVGVSSKLQHPTKKGVVDPCVTAAAACVQHLDVDAGRPVQRKLSGKRYVLHAVRAKLANEERMRPHPTRARDEPIQSDRLNASPDCLGRPGPSLWPLGSHPQQTLNATLPRTPSWNRHTPWEALIPRETNDKHARG